MLAAFACLLVSPPPPPIVQVSPPPPMIVQAAPVVAASTFRNWSHHSGHDCPNCGTYQPWTYTGTAGVRGHSHKCPKCATIWTH